MTLAAVPGYDVLTTARLLRRYFHLHRGIMRALAGWIVAMPRYEDKYVLGYHLWEHAQHAAALLCRLKELRGGLTGPSVDPALARLAEEISDAPGPQAFVRGLYGCVLPAMSAAYAKHMERAQPAANAQEVAILRRISADLDTQCAWGLPAGDIRADAWEVHAEGLIAASGGIMGDQPAPESPVPARPVRFERPHTIVFDSRIARGGLLSAAERAALAPPDELREQFKVFFNEIYAACILASILCDAANEAPFEFLYDAARHCWDEIRHSEFGAIRLRTLGCEPAHCNPVLYEKTESLPFLHRYCHLTLNLEPYFMPRKRPRLEQYTAAGDEASRVFADADWSDEINHVRYGKRWVEYFLQDDARSLEDLKREIAELLGHVSEGAPALAPF